MKIAKAKSHTGFYYICFQKSTPTDGFKEEINYNSQSIYMRIDRRGGFYYICFQKEKSIKPSFAGFIIYASRSKRQPTI